MYRFISTDRTGMCFYLLRFFSIFSLSITAHSFIFSDHWVIFLRTFRTVSVFGVACLLYPLPTNMLFMYIILTTRIERKMEYTPTDSQRLTNYRLVSSRNSDSMQNGSVMHTEICLTISCRLLIEKPCFPRAVRLPLKVGIGSWNY